MAQAKTDDDVNSPFQNLYHRRHESEDGRMISSGLSGSGFRRSDSSNETDHFTDSQRSTPSFRRRHRRQNSGDLSFSIQGFYARYDSSAYDDDDDDVPVRDIGLDASWLEKEQQDNSTAKRRLSFERERGSDEGATEESAGNLNTGDGATGETERQTAVNDDQTLNTNDNRRSEKTSAEAERGLSRNNAFEGNTQNNALRPVRRFDETLEPTRPVGAPRPNLPSTWGTDSPYALHINPRNVDALLIGARFFSQNEIVTLCKETLLDCNVENALYYKYVGDKHELEDVMPFLLDFVRANFPAISKTSSFLGMGVQQCVQLLSDDYLKVDRELDVYYAARAWIDHNAHERLKYTYDVMNCVRFMHISPAETARIVEPESAFFRAPEGRELLLTIYRYHALQATNTNINEFQVTVPPRRKYIPLSMESPPWKMDSPQEASTPANPRSRSSAPPRGDGCRRVEHRARSLSPRKTSAVHTPSRSGTPSAPIRPTAKNNSNAKLQSQLFSKTPDARHKTPTTQKLRVRAQQSEPGSSCRRVSSRTRNARTQSQLRATSQTRVTRDARDSRVYSATHNRRAQSVRRDPRAQSCFVEISNSADNVQNETVYRRPSGLDDGPYFPPSCVGDAYLDRPSYRTDDVVDWPRSVGIDNEYYSRSQRSTIADDHCYTDGRPVFYRETDVEQEPLYQRPGKVRDEGHFQTADSAENRNRVSNVSHVDALELDWNSSHNRGTVQCSHYNVGASCQHTTHAKDPDREEETGRRLFPISGEQHSHSCCTCTPHVSCCPKAGPCCQHVSERRPKEARVEAHDTLESSFSYTQRQNRSPTHGQSPSRENVVSSRGDYIDAESRTIRAVKADDNGRLHVLTLSSYSGYSHLAGNQYSSDELRGDMREGDDSSYREHADGVTNAHHHSSPGGNLTRTVVVERAEKELSRVERSANPERDVPRSDRKSVFVRRRRDSSGVSQEACCSCQICGKGSKGRNLISADPISYSTQSSGGRHEAQSDKPATFSDNTHQASQGCFCQSPAKVRFSDYDEVISRHEIPGFGDNEKKHLPTDTSIPKGGDAGRENGGSAPSSTSGDISQRREPSSGRSEESSRDAMPASGGERSAPTERHPCSNELDRERLPSPERNAPIKQNTSRVEIGSFSSSAPSTCQGEAVSGDRRVDPLMLSPPSAHLRGGRCEHKTVNTELDSSFQELEQRQDRKPKVPPPVPQKPYAHLQRNTRPGQLMTADDRTSRELIPNRDEEANRFHDSSRRECVATGGYREESSCGRVLATSNSRRTSDSAMGQDKPTYFLENTGSRDTSGRRGNDSMDTSANQSRFEDSSSTEFFSTYSDISHMSGGGDGAKWVDTREAHGIEGTFVETRKNTSCPGKASSSSDQGMTRRPGSEMSGANIANNATDQYPTFRNEFLNHPYSPAYAPGSLPTPPRVATMLAVGGLNPMCVDASVPCRVVEQFNPYNNSWSLLTKLPEARHHHACAVMDNFLFLVGGSLVNRDDPRNLCIPTNRCYRYHPEENFWTEIAPLHHPRMYHALAVLKGVLYAVGGQTTGDKYLESVEYYNADTDQWGHCANFFDAVIGVAAIGHRDLVYCIGGFLEKDEDNIVLGTVECYDPRMNSWTTKNPLPGARCHACVGKSGGCLYVLGGATLMEEKEEVVSLASVLRYDEELDNWEHFDSMDTPRHDAGCCVVDDRIFVVGGACSISKEVLSSIECLDLKEHLWLDDVEPLASPALGLSCVTLAE